ncbi:MAG: carboxylesterase family protein, partial [Lachnospiraceae bacterium]|nr:carboxylesterase family protein [Lachnospiraceae bacterium]
AKELFAEKAETFLAFPETGDLVEEGKYAGVSGLECTSKALFSHTEKKNGQQYYYYRFTPDIPGYDNPGTFHSCDLWVFFETLAKCWRPYVGHHYDLARKMCNYWANFIKTGDPNGLDADGSPMPEWKPYTKEAPCEMIFTSGGPVVSEEKETPYKAFLIERVKEGLAK